MNDFIDVRRATRAVDDTAAMIDRLPTRSDGWLRHELSLFERVPTRHTNVYVRAILAEFARRDLPVPGWWR